MHVELYSTSGDVHCPLGIAWSCDCVWTYRYLSDYSVCTEGVFRFLYQIVHARTTHAHSVEILQQTPEHRPEQHNGHLGLERQFPLDVMYITTIGSHEHEFLSALSMTDTP